MAKKYFYVLMLIILLIIIFRSPQLFISPRFWAEEGSIYFAYAYNHAWYNTLFKPFMGYYSLYNLIAAILAAKLVPLRLAPYATTILALIIQLIPFAIILKSKSPLWNNIIKKIIGVLVILFTMPSAEIWLNTINSQFYFLLITFLILIEEISDIFNFKKWFYRLLLLFAGLTGNISSLLTPLFIIKYWLDKNIRENFNHCLIMISCSIVQLLIFIYLLKYGNILNNRMHPFSITTLLDVIWIKCLMLPLFGVKIADICGIYFQYFYFNDLYGYNLLGIFLIAIELSFFFFIFRKSKCKQLPFYFFSWLIIILFSYIFQPGNPIGLLGSFGGQRYFYVPNVILMLMLLLNFFRNDSNKIFNNIRAYICLILLSSGILVGMINFKSSINQDYFSKWPSWSIEVAKWEHDNSYIIKIAPSGWIIKI